MVRYSQASLYISFSLTALTFPKVGFGLWKVENDKAAELVQDAIKAGVRLFDGTYHLAGHSKSHKDPRLM